MGREGEWGPGWKGEGGRRRTRGTGAEIGTGGRRRRGGGGGRNRGESSSWPMMSGGAPEKEYPCK